MRALSSKKGKKILIKNSIKIDNKNFCIYSSSKPTIKSKSFAKQSWFINGKVIEEKRDYCKIEIQENKSYIRANIRAYRKVRFGKYTSMRLSIVTDKFLLIVRSFVYNLLYIMFYNWILNHI